MRAAVEAEGYSTGSSQVSGLLAGFGVRRLFGMLATTNIYSPVLRNPGRKPGRDNAQTNCSTPNKPSTSEMRYETRMTNS